MNHIYRLVFNRALGCTQVVAETAQSQGKGKRASAVVGAVAALGLLAGSGNLFAYDIDGGATVTVPPPLLDLTGQHLFVGHTGVGTLNIQSGGSVTSGWATIIGGQSNSTGTVSVTGTGSMLSSGSGYHLHIGEWGTGTLNIEDSGSVTSDLSTIIGTNNGSTGMVSVTGTGSTLSATDLLYVGESGMGTLNIHTSGSVTSGSDTIIGGNSGSTGTVSVTDTGSTLSSDYSLYVGNSGTGTLNIEDGGSVTSGWATFIGYNNGSTGTVSVTGTGSTLSATDDLYVGESGTGTLNIEDGGSVTSGLSTSIGTNTGSTGTVLVTGTGSRLSATEYLYVGEWGTGTLNIEDGGSVTSGVGTYIGYYNGSTGTVSVTGTDSTLSSGAYLDVGFSGTGTLNIEDGGSVTSDWSTFIGYDNGSTGTVLVTGADSTLSSDDDLYVGYLGTGTLNIHNAGSVTSGQSTIIGTSIGSTGTVSVTGTGSTLSSDDDLYVGDSGTGTLNIQDGGLVNASGGSGVVNLAYSSGSTGTINIGAAEGQAPLAAGSLQAGKIEFGDGDATLVFNHTGTDYSFATPLESTGTGNHQIRHLAGITKLTADNSSFAGTTNIEAGVLKVNGSLGGGVLVKNGGILGGNGTLGSATVQSGGTVAPGNSIGTLNVGNITFNPGSTYEVEINAAGQSDKILASGTAIINGGSVRVLAENGNYAPSTTYTILTAANPLAGAGVFDGVTSNLAFLDPSLSYDPNNVYLTMNRNAVDFKSIGFTRNQIATGGGVESLGAGHAVYDSVVGLSAVQARNAFDQLSGELHASVQGALIEESHWVRDSANDRLRSAHDSIGHGSNFWIRGMGNWGKNDGNSNAASMDRDTRGLMAGFDTQLGERGQGGLLIGKTSTDLHAGRGRGKADVESIHLGLYGALSLNEGLNLRAGAFYSKYDIDSRRTLSFAGFNNRLTDDRNAQSWQTFAELAYRASLGKATLEPFANLATVQLHSDSSSESGGAAALRSSSRDTSTSFLTLGVRPNLELDMGKTKAKLYGSLGWQHAFGDTTPKSRQRFVGAGDTFTVAGTPIAKDTAAIEAGMRMELGANSSLNLSYKGQFSNKSKDQGAQATLEWRF